jgi:DNA-binding cell septation regulator SpoVG
MNTIMKIIPADSYRIHWKPYISAYIGVQFDTYIKKKNIVLIGGNTGIWTKKKSERFVSSTTTTTTIPVGENRIPCCTHSVNHMH